MQITIDNLDGLGAVDYTTAVAAQGRIRITRKLNAPSECVAEVVADVGGLAMPQRRGRMVVSTDDSNVLFTGYLATEPVQVCIGSSTAGAAYVMRLSAVSDEWLLDKQGSGASSSGGTLVAQTAASLMDLLTARAQSGEAALSFATADTATPLMGAFLAKPASAWSTNAGAAASAAYAGYRAIAGEVMLQPAGAVQHALSDADGTLDVHALQLGMLRELANDVTLSGEEEPAAYVSESFLGDGSTTVFVCSEPAFAATARTLVNDGFGGAAINPQTWSVSDPGSHFSLTGAGLTLNGGNGLDGQTTLTALDLIEMGGSVVLELGSVQFGAASDGMLGGLYQGTPVLANCFAGFRVRQSVSGTGGVTVLVPVVNGVEVGTVFTPTAGHLYTLRLRLHCAEMLRSAQVYRCMVDGVVQSFGNAGGVESAMDIVFELVDQGNASNTPATVLYDTAAGSAMPGAIASTPANCSVVAVNSTQMFGSVGSIKVTRPGSAWIVSTLPDGTRQTRLMGVAGEGVDCVISYGSANSSSKVTFLAGRVPVAGERVTVMYRTQQRSVARLADAASIAAEAVGASAGVSRWLGKVLLPAARSSADCESAAQAVLAMSTSRSAALSGTYAAVNPSDDIWPGDVLSVTSNAATTALLARAVTVADAGCVPEVLRYEIALANDWGTQLEDGLGLRLSDAIATNALLPQTAANGPAEVLADLAQLTLTALSETSLQVDAGIAPPAGGGFEVRRKDWLFSTNVDATDLVLRSPVRSFSIPRAAQVEKYFVRMYDASTPPLYSRFSSAVFVNAPVG